MALTLDIVNLTTGQVEQHILDGFDGGQTARLVTLQCVEGASGLQIVLRNGNEVLVCAEIDADSSRLQEVMITRNNEGQYVVQSGLHTMYLLSVRDASLVTPPLLRPVQSDQLDLLYLIDGTTRGPIERVTSQPGAEESRYSHLLNKSNAWMDQAGKLAALAEHLVKNYEKCRFGLIAFADQPLVGISNPELTPNYFLHPDPEEAGWKQEVWSDKLPTLKSRFLSLRGSSGGDFVDALADALNACRKAGWRASARRVIVLFGDSPGYSVLEPPNPLTNFRLRNLDVNTEADALLSERIELVTIYREDPDVSYQTDVAAPIIRYARKQYRAIATCGDYALTTENFDPAELASLLMSSTSRVFGRGACPGALPSIKPPE